MLTLMLLPLAGDLPAGQQPATTPRTAPAPRSEPPPPRETGGGWANIFRTVTSALGGGVARRRPSGGATATIGVRGLGAGAITAATPDEAAVRAMETLAVRGSEAADFADAAGLVPQPLPLTIPR
ncbi:MAG TPA: hypothetical protein DCY89_03270 [Gammaproteobacteria bacterium]|nr:hypothetical protein [Gammaproteobacteria bacterium]